MKRILGLSILLVVSGLRVFAEAPTLESTIDSVSLFKNGLTVVRRTVEVPTNGIYRIEDVPAPVHGTFWIESEAKVEARVTTQNVEVPFHTRGWGDLQDGLAGHTVSLFFRDGTIPPVSGTVVKVESAESAITGNRSYQQSQSYYDSRVMPSPQRSFLVLETEGGRIYADSSMIAYADIQGATNTVMKRRPVLLLDIAHEENQPAKVSISYLTRGLAWAPSYRVDVSETKRLKIEQKAVIKNELGDITDAEFYLISGFPSIKFAHVTSPLSLSTSWANFFQQLNQDPRANRSGSQILTQNAIVANRPLASDNSALSAIPDGEGPDVHYQSIGKRTLMEGDALSLSVASGTTAYDHIVEWLVPDTRSADGRYIPDYQRSQDPDKFQDAAWDAIRFRNPLPFPMTTGAAMITTQGRFLGEQTSYWVNQGERTTLHVTKALSIRTRAVEHEEPGQREIVFVGGDDYQKTRVTGELSVSNHRDEAVKLVIRRRFSGELLKADGNPTSTLREEGVWSINKRNELNWQVTLEAGAEITLTYSYSVLVNR